MIVSIIHERFSSKIFRMLINMDAYFFWLMFDKQSCLKSFKEFKLDIYSNSLKVNHTYITYAAAVFFFSILLNMNKVHKVAVSIQAFFREEFSFAD